MGDKNLRILQFISSPAAGGAETYVKDISINMVQKGHDVHLLFLQSAQEGGRDADFHSRFLEALTVGGVTHSFLGIASRRMPWRGVSGLRNIIREFQPDVLHCHLYYALVFALFNVGVPVVYTHHNFRLKLPSWFYHIFDRRVSAYVGICHACTKMLNNVSCRPVVSIDNSVNSNRLLPRLNPSRDDMPVRLVFVGRLCDQKNIPLLLQACARLADLDFELYLAGEGPNRDSLQQLVTRLNLQTKVHFLGNISTVPELMHDADIFVMSSAWEGLPIAQIEATLTGLPVLVTNVGGCAEPVHKCANGLVVDDLCPVSYADALRRLVEDEDLRNGFSRNATRYGSHYDIVRAVKEHLDFYESIIVEA